ncbi:hypothetical protein HEK616_35910 [Streptomyces nigrescens]|uniref:Cytidine deaminase n=1 Tax=Streptomyces nigrescens TaxID=1920 RepID=A0ABM7ZUT1_STRNI|nr:hypothetical protein HEK616_35910 [Streptomyces nigrescens]
MNAHHFIEGPCAELVLIGTAAAQAAYELDTTVAVGDRDRGVAPPCGRCRPVLLGYSPTLKVIVGEDDRIRTAFITHLLPEAMSEPTTGSMPSKPPLSTSWHRHRQPRHQPARTTHPASGSPVPAPGHRHRPPTPSQAPPRTPSARQHRPPGPPPLHQPRVHQHSQMPPHRPQPLPLPLPLPGNGDQLSRTHGSSEQHQQSGPRTPDERPEPGWDGPPVMVLGGHPKTRVDDVLGPRCRWFTSARAEANRKLSSGTSAPYDSPTGPSFRSMRMWIYAALWDPVLRTDLPE